MVINLEEIILAKKVVSEVPRVLASLDKAYELLYTSKDYIDIARVLNEIEDAQIMLDLILKVYTQVLKDKGVPSE